MKKRFFFILTFSTCLFINKVYSQINNIGFYGGLNLITDYSTDGEIDLFPGGKVGVNQKLAVGQFLLINWLDFEYQRNVSKNSISLYSQDGSFINEASTKVNSFNLNLAPTLAYQNESVILATGLGVSYNLSHKIKVIEGGILESDWFNFKQYRRTYFFVPFIFGITKSKLDYYFTTSFGISDRIHNQSFGKDYQHSISLGLIYKLSGE